MTFFTSMVKNEFVSLNFARKILLFIRKISFSIIFFIFDISSDIKMKLRINNQ